MAGRKSKKKNQRFAPARLMKWDVDAPGLRGLSARSMVKVQNASAAAQKQQKRIKHIQTAYKVINRALFTLLSVMDRRL